MSGKLTRGRSLLEEARDVGLLGQETEIADDDVLGVLRGIAEADVPDLPPTAEDRTDELRRQLKNLQAEYREGGAPNKRG